MRYSVALSVVGMVFAAASAQARPLDTAAWLVDLGRDYPRTPQAGLSDADAEVTLLLMQAASRVNPGPPEPYLWQYDMLAALGQDDAARTALGNYVEREPGALSAHLDWVAFQIEQRQTAEDRAEFCRDQLRRPNLPGPIASDLHRRLADFHRNRGEVDKAIAEARAALQAYDLNFDARQLLEAILADRQPQRASDAARLDEILFELAAGPGDAGRAWAAADDLMLLSLWEPADRLYDHAAKLLQISDPAGDLPAALTARILALRKLGKTADADAQVKKASDAWKDLLSRPAGTVDAERMAEMAWFYVQFEPDPAQAEKLARQATALEPGLIVGHRALGAALRLLGRMDEAKAELKGAADKDMAAAAEYAQVLDAGGDKPNARQILAGATTRPADPLGQFMLARAQSKLGVTPPASKPAAEEARQSVARFNWAVLDYPLHPDKYMSLTVTTTSPRFSPGEPWPITARIRNIGPFPIIVGTGMMVRPDLLISVDTMGDKPRTTGPTIRLTFGKAAVLAVGQTAEVTSTVELGQVRAGMIGTPQRSQAVTVNAVVSPVRVMTERGQEDWTADIGGLKAEPLQFRRVPFLPDNQSMADLRRRLESSDPLERISAMELFAMLLAESQHIAAGRLNYTARPIDEAAAQRAVLGRVDDPDWQVRAHLAECLRWVELKPDVTSSAMRLLSDQHWLVRGLTMRALADHYGPDPKSNFRTAVLTRASAADPDEWVRQLASALSARISTATSQPASQPEATK